MSQTFERFLEDLEISCRKFPLTAIFLTFWKTTWRTGTLLGFPAPATDEELVIDLISSAAEHFNLIQGLDSLKKSAGEETEGLDQEVFEDWQAFFAAAQEAGARVGIDIGKQEVYELLSHLNPTIQIIDEILKRSSPESESD